MTVLSDQNKWFDRILAQAVTDLPGADLTWLQEKREQAKAEMLRLGKPTRKQEVWRYTSVDNLLKQEFESPTPDFSALQAGDIRDQIFFADDDCYRLVFANGRIVTDLSRTNGLEKEVSLGSLRASLGIESETIRSQILASSPSTHVFSELNAAAINDGLYLHVSANTKVSKPIEVIYLTLSLENQLVVQPRNLIVLDEGAEATLVEQYISTGDSVYFNNGVTDIKLAKDSKLTHAWFQDESHAAYHISNINLVQDSNSVYRNTSIALGGVWSRTDINASMKGEGAHCDINGLYTIGEKQLIDFHLNIEHLVPNTTSEEHFKGILYGKGRAVFDGRILVEKDAQLTNANLSNANLLLTRDAEVDTKPQLEIYADDVKCSHGTTIGQLDPDHIFYLRSRGISEVEARKMLSLGFANEVLMSCPTESMRTRIEAKIRAQLLSANTKP